ncbi:hypothetical protein [Curtobacterium sp. 179-B 9B NHS]|uniref:hypothetical protein n=1 Tax=Curtobacterium sp. 179-B 9B NHS TaxID=3374293 RepID=UPI0038790934
MSTGHGNAPLRLTPAVRIAAVLAAAYGFSLVALAIVLATDQALHRGTSATSTASLRLAGSCTSSLRVSPALLC